MDSGTGRWTTNSWSLPQCPILAFFFSPIPLDEPSMPQNLHRNTNPSTRSVRRVPNTQELVE